MEQSIENVIKDVPVQNDEPKPLQIRPPKSKNGPMHVLKVALFMVRGRSKKTNVFPLDTIESKNGWKKLVGSMRLLHLHSNQSPRSFPQGKPFEHTTSPQIPPSPPCESVGDFTDCPPEEESSFPPSPASSRYASAIGLNELVQSDEENEKQEVIIEETTEEGDGDEKIDIKADEFIAQFYQQLRLQRLNSLVDRRYQKRSQRSLGYITGDHPHTNALQTIDE